MDRDYDYIVIGSGFGGSVSALRLTEKGYRVLVLEMGKRYRTADFPRTNWNLRKYLWMPKLFLYGIQQITLLSDVLVFHGAGVGGGSLVYANTLLVPPDRFFGDPAWAHLADWKQALAPHYETARRMLGVVECPHITETDRMLGECAAEIERGHTFAPTPVGVYFGEPGVARSDPFFGGEGPPRTGCTLCGGCMVGCRFGAKNTLDQNYLYLAEARGASIEPERRVLDVRPLPGGGYRVVAERSTALWRRRRHAYTASGVVFSAGVLGTVKLLMQCKERGSLSGLSERLGDFVRTNSEALTAVSSRRRDVDYSRGVAISASVAPDDHTTIEVVRYSAGSDFMSLLSTVLTGGGGSIPRPLRFLCNILRHPLQFVRLLVPFGWARRTAILLTMQTLDNSLRLRMRRRWWWPFGRRLDSDRGTSDPAPTYIPVANQMTLRMAEKIDGIPQSVLPEVVLNLSSTAHILGGCPMGDSPATGVIDAHNRVFGYQNLYVVDGSMIPANLGVNPSLTITAMAEHAMSHVPPSHAECRMQDAE